MRAYKGVPGTGDFSFAINVFFLYIYPLAQFVNREYKSLIHRKHQFIVSIVCFKRVKLYIMYYRSYDIIEGG